MGGTDLELAKADRSRPPRPCRVTIAGGVTTAEEIRALDDASAPTPRSAWRSIPASSTSPTPIMAPLVTDRPDGLWPTVVVDERGIALGLVYSSREVGPRGGAAAHGRLPVALARPVGEGRDQRGRRRSCSASTSTATATARASSSASTARASATSTPAPAGARTPGSAISRARSRPAAHGARGQLHRQAVRRSRPPGRQAARGGGRAGRGRGPRRTSSGRRRTCSTSPSPASPREGIDLAEVEAHLDRRGAQGDAARLTSRQAKHRSA